MMELKEKINSHAKNISAAGKRIAELFSTLANKFLSWIRSILFPPITRERKEAPATEAKENSRKIHKYKVYLFAMCAFGVLLIVSITVEVLTGSSLSAWLVLRYPGLAPAFASLRSIITTKAILKIAETIGFCSIFIAWIYAALDKTELGLRYGSLLEELYPGYNWLVLCHLVAFLTCVWMSKIQRLESAFIALVIIIFGCLLQWKTLQNIILFSKPRRKVAIDRWNSILTQSEARGHNDMLLTIFNMADSISLQAEKGRFEMQKCFSHALLKYICHPALKPKQRLQGSADIWERLLRNRERNERLILVQEILKNCASDSSLVYICIGYVLWLYKDCTGRSPEVHDILNKVCDDLLSLEQGPSGGKECPAFDYMNSTFVLIGMIQFLCGNARLSSNLFGMKPDRSIPEGDIELLRTAMSIIFEEQACKKYLSVATDMLFHTSSNLATS